MYTVRKSNLDDVLYLQDKLRPEDVAELASLSSTPEKSLFESYFYSEQCFTADYENKPMAMFGAGRIMLKDQNVRLATVWLMSTPEIEKYPKEFLRKSGFYIDQFMDDYDILVGAVDKNNTKYIKWLKWHRFQELEPIETINGGIIPFARKEGGIECRYRQLLQAYHCLHS